MSTRRSLYTFIAPRYWPVWIGMGLLRLLLFLPHRAGLFVGKLIGRLTHRLSASRRAVVRRNLELCFPDLDTEQRNQLARRHFEALGMSLVEMGLGRWASDKKIERLTTLEGVEHLNQALAAGEGVILLSAHFTTLEASGRILALRSPGFDAVFRKNRSEFITELQRTGRERSAQLTIEKRDIKSMVRRLREGHAVWYAPDQSYDRKGSAVIDFFGIPAMHTTATSTLARLGKARVVPFLPRRSADGRYHIRVYPPFDDFPGKDPIADTERYISLLEEHIRTCPEQYFWIHRKFKNLPAGYPDYYSDLDALK